MIRKRLALAALLLTILGLSAYQAMTKAEVQVTDDGTMPPPSFP